MFWDMVTLYYNMIYDDKVVICTMYSVIGGYCTVQRMLHNVRWCHNRMFENIAIMYHVLEGYLVT